MSTAKCSEALFITLRSVEPYDKLSNRLEEVLFLVDCAFPSRPYLALKLSFRARAAPERNNESNSVRSDDVQTHFEDVFETAEGAIV